MFLRIPAGDSPCRAAETPLGRGAPPQCRNPPVRTSSPPPSFHQERYPASSLGHSPRFALIVSCPQESCLALVPCTPSLSPAWQLSIRPAHMHTPRPPHNLPHLPANDHSLESQSREPSTAQENPLCRVASSPSGHGMLENPDSIWTEPRETKRSIHLTLSPSRPNTLLSPLPPTLPCPALLRTNTC